ncbi:MAG: dTDP-4-dehydrorhamnose 3,5-epimerase [Elusimicrobiota bacterium]|nr:dTDP-4-dehydrorhamnose 3,5-epimerase [Elusimicrobiota bacterium]
MPFKFKKFEIPELVLITPKVFPDERGFFLETYKKTEFAKAGIKENFVQENHSRSKKNVLRGLHFQKSPKAQGKLVQCLRGKIFDVAVDIRKKSPTFLKWVSVELSQNNGQMLYIPQGFAHGFLVLSNSADVVYKCTAEYSPEHESGIIWNDPKINIVWPSSRPSLSHKDKKLPSLKNIKF